MSSAEVVVANIRAIDAVMATLERGSVLWRALAGMRFRIVMEYVSG